MRSTLEMTADGLLAQATCAVLLNDVLKATAWLVSDEGHLLTAGHIFERTDRSVKIKVQFMNEAPLDANRIMYDYSRPVGVDFAILKIARLPSGRSSLPVALTKNAEGKCKLQGYGKTLYEQSSGSGEFFGIYYPQNFTDNFLFELRSPETGEHGFSGAPVYSEKLGAVVALQTEATQVVAGAGRDTVLAMPLYRIAQRWSDLSGLIKRPATRTRESSQKYNSPKQYLEYRIRESYQFYSRYGEEDGAVGPAEELKEKYHEVIKYYLQIYFLLCRRQRLTPHAEIVKIGDDFPDVDSFGEPHTLASTTPSEIYTNIPGTRIVVGVSQMFRIADLLTRPESVRARRFYSAITDVNKVRRTLSEGKSFALGSLGSLGPVIAKSEEYKKFWLPGVPDLRPSWAQPLFFVPYELNLTELLQQFHSEFGPIFESSLINTSDTIKNSQISGRLRIYPPGIGVVSLSLAMQFKQEIHIELVAQIAHNIEEMLFVDPHGRGRPYSDLMLDIINQVINSLFLQEGYNFEERLWLPPATTYSFPNPHGLVPEEKINELAYLMSLAPANAEDLQHLQSRIKRSLKTGHWQNNRILAVAGDEVALFFIGDAPNKMSRKGRDRLLLWLSETRELISAAAYAQLAFAGEIDKIFNPRLLDDTWLPPENEKFAYLKSLLETMRQVLRAISSLSAETGHLRNQKTGILIPFAKDVWTYSNPVNRPAMEMGLAYLADWLSDAQSRKPHPEIADLIDVLRGVQAIRPPFPSQTVALSSTGMSVEQEQLEQRLLDQIPEIEEILKRYEPEEFAEADSRSRVMQKLRRQLGL